MSGFEPVFRIDDVYNHVDDFVNEKISKMNMIAHRIGEEFVNKSRAIGNYTDQTSNLRNSIGYMIIEDGKDIYRFLASPGTDGGIKASEALDEALQNSEDGFQIIGTAGMEYAAAVQSLDGYDVIAGGGTEAEKLLKKLLKALEYENSTLLLDPDF